MTGIDIPSNGEGAPRKRVPGEFGTGLGCSLHAIEWWGTTETGVLWILYWERITSEQIRRRDARAGQHPGMYPEPAVASAPASR